MELMEEGNLMDRVQILLQRDLSYYEEHQTVLQENLCLSAVGGPFDFPRYASFAAVKLVKWWEEEFVACFQHASGLIEGEQHLTAVKRLPPLEFVTMVQQSSEKLLEHLHTLSQESLDHADLTVLTATLGAAALTKNALHCFNEALKKETKGLSLHQTSRLMQEMVEALAERLLDLHCRLVALYVLQDAESLHWESQHAFFEGQRGSYTVQMWWFYMQGAREDLWNTVPPKTAQRVLAGMLNESLTILTSRYSQAKPSAARSAQLITDISNILVCVRHLLPSICNTGDELLGLSGGSKAVRDIHAKCHYLLCTLLCRGCPLATLYKVFRKGIDLVPVFHNGPSSSSTWFLLVAPSLFPNPSLCNVEALSDGTAIVTELSVLVAQPEASWSLLLKILLMRNSATSSLILKQLLSNAKFGDAYQTQNACGGFLCGKAAGCSVDGSVLLPSQVLGSLVFILVVVCGEPEGGGSHKLATALAPLLHHDSLDWSCMDRRQVWADQRRPAWLTALVDLANYALENLLPANKCELTVGDILDMISHLADTLPVGLIMAAKLFDDVLPADVNPFGGSTLLHLLGAAVYSQLSRQGLERLAEQWCNLQSSDYQTVLHKIMASACDLLDEGDGGCHSRDCCIEEVPQVGDVLVSSLLLSSTGRNAVKVLYKYVQHNAAWLMTQFGAQGCNAAPLNTIPAARPAAPYLLHSMFHVGSRTFDELLHGGWQLDWSSLLHTKLGLKKDYICEQLHYRYEFREPQYLSEHDAKVVAALSQVFTADSEPVTM